MLVNSASYRINLEAMRACLSAGAGYLDLGGLYWMTQRQLMLSEQFERAGLLAVLGIGSSPGKTNLMAARAVRELGDQPDTIDVAAAGRDFGAPADGRLRPPYAIQTLLDELTLEPVVLRGSDATRIVPLTPGGELDFGRPDRLGRDDLHAAFGAGDVRREFRLPQRELPPVAGRPAAGAPAGARRR